MVQYNRLVSDTALANYLKRLEQKIDSQATKGSGQIVVTDPETGVETIIGELPDGSTGFEQFVGDTTPPPVATTPFVSGQPGTYIITWDGEFVNNEIKPRDFTHVNVIGHMMNGTDTVLSIPVGVIRLPTESVFVGLDIANPDELWQFSLEAVDYNGNTAAESARSLSTIMQDSVASIVDVENAIADLDTKYDGVVTETTQLDTRLTDAEAELDQNALNFATVDGRLDNVDTHLVDLDTKYDGVITDAGSLDTRLTDAETDLTAHATRLTDAETELTDVFGQLDTVDSRIDTAKQAALDAAAVDAQNKADAILAAAKNNNLLINGDFEKSTGFIPDYRTSTLDSRSGSFAGVINADTWRTIYWNNVKVIEGETLEVRLWAKKVGTIGLVGPSVAVDLYDATGNDIGTDLYATNISVPTVSTTFQEYVWRIGPIAAGTSSVKLRTTSSGSTYGTGQIIFDDVLMFDATALVSAEKAKTDAIAAAAAYTDNAKFEAITAQAYSLNPSFDDWTGAAPNWFVAYGTGPTKEATLVRRGQYAARFDCTDTTTNRGLNWNGMLNHAPNLEYWTVEVTFRLVSGTLGGAGVRLDWSGMTNNQAWLALNTEVPNPIYDKWYTVSKTLQRPANATGTWTAMDGYLFANFTASALGAMATKDIVFDWLNVRPATAEEINAGLALTMAGSKSRVYYNTGVATGTATADGDLWRQRDANNNIIAEWRWNGTPPAGSWVKTAISSEAISNLDVGKLTAGSANMLQATIDKLVANTANFQTVDVKNLFATTGTMDTAVINKLWTDVVNSRKITTEMLAVGAFDNLVDNPSFEDGGNRWSSYSSTYWTFPKTGGNTGTGVCRFSGITTRSLGPISANVPHEQGDTYRISGWVKTTATSGHTGELCLYWADGAGAYISNTNLYITTATANWQRFTFNATPPSTARYVSVRLNATIPVASNEYFFDDISLTRASNGELLVDGSVTAEKVAADAITAKNIIVGDFQNIAIGSDFEDITAIPWNLHTDHIRSTAVMKFGTASLRLGPGTTTSTRASYFNGDFRVRENEQWYFSFWAYIDSSFNGDGNSKLRIASNSINGTHLLSISYNGATPNTWTKFEGTLTVPVGTTVLVPMLWSSHTTGYAYIDDIQIRRVAEASLIQNLGVEKLVANNATMDQAVIEKLWSDVVHAHKITTDMMLISAGANLLADPDIQDVSNWSGGFATTTGGMNGKGSILIPMSSSQTGSYYGMPGTAILPTQVGFRVVPGSTYRVGAWVRAAVDIPVNQVKVYLRLYNGVSTTATFASDVSGSVPQNTTVIPANTWAFVSGMTTVPADSANTWGVFGLFKQATFTTSAVRWSDPIVQQAAAGELVVDGTITAKKLESSLILTTEVIAGSATGTHAKMNPSGFHAMALLPGETVPKEVISIGTTNDDYFGVTNAAGEQVMAVSSTGDVTVETLSARSDVLINGTPVLESINDRPKGLIAWAARSTPGKYWAGATSHPYLHLVFPVEAGRAYAIRTNSIGMDGSSTSSDPLIRVHYTQNGNGASTSDTVIAQAISTSSGIATYRSAITINRIVTPATSGEWSILLAYGAARGSGKISAPGANANFLTVEDMGPAVPETGESRDGTSDNSTVDPTPPAIKKNYDQTWNATGLRSFVGSGGTYAYNTGYMYSGLSPAGYGDLSSMAIFPNLTTTLSGATVTGVWIYVYYDFWYYGSGGDAYIGLHGQTALTSTKPTKTYSHAVSSSWPRAAGRWIKMSSSTYDGWRTGTHRGFTLGGSGGGYERYGYAHDPRLRITWTK